MCSLQWDAQSRHVDFIFLLTVLAYPEQSFDRRCLCLQEGDQQWELQKYIRTSTDRNGQVDRGSRVTDRCCSIFLWSTVQDTTSQGSTREPSHNRLRVTCVITFCNYIYYSGSIVGGSSGGSLGGFVLPCGPEEDAAASGCCSASSLHLSLSICTCPKIFLIVIYWLKYMSLCLLESSTIDSARDICNLISCSCSSSVVVWLSWLEFCIAKCVICCCRSPIWCLCSDMTCVSDIIVWSNMYSRCACGCVSKVCKVCGWEGDGSGVWVNRCTGGGDGGLVAFCCIANAHLSA